MSNSLTSSETKRLFDSPQQEAYLQLWRTFDRLREIEDRVFDRFGISAQQYNALRILNSLRPEFLSTADLSARLVSRAPDMTRMLDKLESLELIERCRLPQNRRIVQAKITASGTRFIKQLSSEIQACNQQQLGHLTADQLRQLVELLVLVRQPHEEQLDSPWPCILPATT